MNFKPSFLIIGLELVVSTRTRVYDVIYNVLHIYLPLSSSPGMTITYFCHDAKRGGRGVVEERVQDLTVRKRG